MDLNPEFIRVKRRRDEESVGAILIDEQNRSKKGKFIYKKTDTIGLDTFQDKQDVTPLLKLSKENDKKHFILETYKKKRRYSEAVNETEEKSDVKVNQNIPNNLPAEIFQMLNDYLSLNKDNSELEATRKKPSKKHFKGEAAKVHKLPSQDYVYDIYHLEPLTDNNLIPESNIGRVTIVNIDIDLVHDEESDLENQFSLDDDSNDENFYRNDYPEDEDDDRSILFGSEGEEIAADNKELFIDEYENNRNVSDDDNEGAYNAEDAIEAMKEDYSHLFDKFGASGNILQSIASSNFVDMDAIDDDPEEDEYSYEEETGIEEYDKSNYNDDSTIQRNIFFKTDNDDPLASHRDKIFGRLQHMIDQKDIQNKDP